VATAFWLLAADPFTGPAYNVFAGYGIVGLLAFGGLVFAWRVFNTANSERIAAHQTINDLQRELLTQAAEHKNELLDIYRAVMPVLESATATVKQSTQLIEEQRMAERMRGHDRQGP
jgi:hypothetical protein